MRCVRAVLLLLLITSLVRAEGGLPIDVLKSIKNATVFVKVEAGKVSATGSGFVLRTEKDVAYIITNHHVIRPTVMVTQGKEKGARPVPVKVRNGTVSVVFRSGTTKEQVVRAMVIGDFEKRDLALLKVTGVKDLPEPLSMDRSPEINETMPIWVVGFPYGKALSPSSKRHPAITISKGSVSSLRLNDAGELAFIQIDGGLNPGNSGGPVVDEKGRLVGIAVARVKDSNIGLVIPSQGVTQILRGFLDIHFNLRPDKDAVKVNIAVRLVDPRLRLRGVVFHYAPGAGKGQQRVSTLPMAKQLKMEMMDQIAIGQLTWTFDKGSDLQIVFQTEHVDGEGKTVFGEVRNFVLKKTPPPVVAGPGGLPKGKPLSKEDLSAALADLKGDSVIKRRNACDRLAFAEPGMERKEVFAALEPLLTDANEVTRYRAVRAHVRWANKDALDTYRELLKIETSTIVRGVLIEALAGLAGAEAADAIAARLAVKDDRAAAGKALKSIGASAEKAVAGCLGYRDPEARIEACKILKDIGTANSVAPLQKASDGLRGAAAEQVDRAARDAIDAIGARK
jgi:hypothetical protein